MAHEVGALRGKDLERVTVDTTVQPKAITFPTDAKLLHAAIKGLNRLATKHGVRLRQSYLRIAKNAAMMASRYAHAKQFKRHQRQLLILVAGSAGSSATSAARSKVGQSLEEAIRPSARRGPRRSARSSSASAAGSSIPPRPGGRCLGKGKAPRRTSTASKPRIVTNDGLPRRPVRAARQGVTRTTPYDGHTLRHVIDDNETLTGCAIERAYVNGNWAVTGKSSPRLHLQPEAPASSE